MTDTEDMDPIDRLLVKLARVWVPAHPRVRNGQREWVDGHWREVDAIQRDLGKATGRERDALLRALGKRTSDAIADDDADTPSTTFGMRWDPTGPKRREVREAKLLSKGAWDDVPLSEVDPSELWATEERVVSRTVNRLSQSGKLREGYDVQVVRASDGRLYIADGHHRVAVANARGAKTLKVRILDLSRSGVAARKLERSGGFSLRPNGREPDGGFMVSMPGAEESYSAKQITMGMLRDYMERRKELLAQPDTYFGGWLDRRSGRVYLDVSKNVQSADEAKRLGRLWKQLAVFDLDKEEEVRLARGASDREAVFLSKDSAEEAWAELQALIEAES